MVMAGNTTERKAPNILRALMINWLLSLRKTVLKRKDTYVCVIILLGLKGKWRLFTMISVIGPQEDPGNAAKLSQQRRDL